MALHNISVKAVDFTEQFDSFIGELVNHSFMNFLFDVLT